MTNIGPFSQDDLNTLWTMSDAQKKVGGIQVFSNDEAKQAMTINTPNNGTISVRRKPYGRWQDMNVGSITEYDDD